MKNQLIIRVLNHAVLVCFTIVIAGCASQGKFREAAQTARVKPLLGTFGTYDAEPRKPDARVDVDRLVAELVTIKAETYNFLIYHGSNDWQDLKLFLPKARENNIKVWVTLVPPSEPPPSEPFRLDYQRWAVEIATLSVKEPNLVAWSIDDFSYDSKIFTVEYIKKMVEGSHSINPKLAFVPCLYFKQMKPALVEKYRPCIDGIIFPYRHEMGKVNLSDWDTLEKEVASFRQSFGPSVPVIVDVYATKHSQLGDSTPEYVRQVMTVSHGCADGVLIYCHQYEDKSPKKYHVIKTLFNQWAGEKNAR